MFNALNAYDVILQAHRIEVESPWTTSSSQLGHRYCRKKDIIITELVDTDRMLSLNKKKKRMRIYGNNTR